ncbi:MAG: FtsX-like permease family protein [Candidatus Micrarchaeaceae archaeon]
MKINDLFSLGIKGIAERRLRTALTILTIVIGISAIVALISLVSGISASISKALESTGPTTLYLMPSGQSLLTDADIAEIESLPYVSNVTPMVSFSGNISEAGTSTAVTVYGIANYSLAEAIGGINILAGTAYNNTNLPYALVGYDIAFPSPGSQQYVSIDQPIYLTARMLEASKTITIVPVGILDKYGSSAFISPDSSIFMPLQAVESLTNRYSYSALIVKAKNISVVDSLDTLLTDIYGNNARIISVEALAATVSSIIGTLGLLLGGIAGISLLVAGISILSIMMVSVAERTHEIGILKSIGFKRSDVMMLFLSEAVIIGLAGGVIGIATGSAVSFILPSLLGAGSGANTSPAPATAAAGHAGGGFYAGGPGNAALGGPSSSSSFSSLSITPVISPIVIVASLIIAIIVSVAASIYPAWKASTIDPIEALRSE